MEAVVLGCVTLAPWAFGAAEPVFEFILNGAVCLLLALWGLRMLLEWRFVWRKCPVVLCLAGLFLTGVVQILPLSRTVLGWLAPATAAAYEQLFPAAPEVLPDEQARLSAATPPGSTISLYPGATQRALLRLLAVIALFAVVRNNLTSSAAMWRLSIAVVANGVLLALVGLLQFFTSPSHVLYWTFPSPGMVFGPFVCRTHFACWANVCIGLGVGLLLQAAHSTAATTPDTRSLSEQILDKLSAPLSMLQEPRVLWIAVGLAVLLSSVLFSLSRGGVLALLGASLVVGVLQLRQRVRLSAIAGVLLGLTLALGLAAWFGLGAVQGRLATLWEGKALEESRLPLWKSTLPIIGDFPLWGTGYGTFQYVEPRHRNAAASTTVVYDHAHNEFLEALVEGGVVRLVWSLLAIAAVLRLGWRAVRWHAGRSTSGLALGGLFAVVTLLLHSVGDFGLHLPAIAFLAAVVCAQLCGMGEETGHAAEEPVYSLGGIAPVLGALVLALVGLLLVGESWRVDRVEKWRFAAYRLSDQNDVESRRRQVAFLEQAARVAPGSAVVHAELGQVHLDAWWASLERLHHRDRVCEAALLVSVAPVPFWSSGLDPTLTHLMGRLPAFTAVEELARAEEEQHARTHLTAALKHLLQARDLCPLLLKPHLRLAAYAHALKQGDLSTVYLERAAWLSPFDPELQNLRGLQNAGAESTTPEKR